MLGCASAGDVKIAAAKIAIKTRILTPGLCFASLLINALIAIKRG
jgi:hypothetical protein